MKCDKCKKPRCKYDEHRPAVCGLYEGFCHGHGGHEKEEERCKKLKPTSANGICDICHDEILLDGSIPPGRQGPSLRPIPHHGCLPCPSCRPKVEEEWREWEKNIEHALYGIHHEFGNDFTKEKRITEYASKRLRPYIEGAISTAHEQGYEKGRTEIAQKYSDLAKEADKYGFTRGVRAAIEAVKHEVCEEDGCLCRELALSALKNLLGEGK